MKSSVYAKKGLGMKKCVLIVLSAIALSVSTGASTTHAAHPTYYSCAASGPGFAAAAYGLTKEQADAFKQETKANGATAIKCTKI
jgi:hypothetical protein